MTFFESLLSEVENGKSNIQGLSYKKKVICMLNKSKDFTASKVDLAKGLSSINSDKPHPYFMSHPTVFDVLSKRLGLIEKIGDSYKFKGNLTKDQSKEIMRACQKGLRGLKY